MRLQNDEREAKCLVDKLGTLVGQFFSTGGAFAPPVKQLKKMPYGAPSGVQGQSPWSGGQRGIAPPPEAEKKLNFDSTKPL